MKFWDREKEIKDLKRHIKSEPNAILFVYGPKSSGKSTLLDYAIKEIKREKNTCLQKNIKYIGLILEENSFQTMKV